MLVIWDVLETHLAGTGPYFPDLSNDMFLWIQNEACSLIYCRLGYIAYDVHLCDQILIFKEQPEDPKKPGGDSSKQSH